MAYPYQLSDLRSDVLSRLGEPSNSRAGDLPNGTGGAAEIITAATITQYLNEAQEDLARGCYPILDYGTITVPAGTQSFALAVVSVPSGNSLWAARGLSWNNLPLQRCSHSALEVWYPTWVTDITGTPQYWFDQGEDGICLYPRPSATQTVMINGLALPKRLVEDTDAPTWLQSDLAKLLVFYAASMIAVKNAQNAALQARAPVWRQEYEAGKSELLARLWSNDPHLAGAHYSQPAESK